jgi:hypothetical protein
VGRDAPPDPRLQFNSESNDRAPAKRVKTLAHLAIELTVNIVLPWLVYTLLSPRYGDFVGLVASAAPPTLWSLYELLLFRMLDALSILVLAGIALSLLAVGLGGSPRMLMVRDNLFSVPIGLVFLISAATSRPVIYYLASAVFARNSPERRAAFEANWQRPAVLRTLRITSAVWGAGLIAQGSLLAWMALTWPIGRFLILSPIIGYGTIAALALWTYLYQQAVRRRTERTIGIAPAKHQSL